MPYNLLDSRSVDSVDSVLEDIQSQLDVASEIEQAISQPISSLKFDEDELEDELAALEADNEQVWGKYLRA